MAMPDTRSTIAISRTNRDCRCFGYSGSRGLFLGRPEQLSMLTDAYVTSETTAI